MEYDEITEFIVLFVMAGYAAYRFMRWLWPIVQMRKTITAVQMMEHALLAPQEKSSER